MSPALGDEPCQNYYDAGMNDPAARELCNDVSG
jgi:hypothetical protein